MLDATAGATITGGGIRFTRVAGFSGQVGDELDFFANTGLSIDPA